MIITVIEESYPSAFNMARDLSLLTRANDEGVIILRLYSWAEPTISLGRLQRADEVLDMASVEADGITVVHRPTGGRAVLHKGDFTYALMVPQVLQSSLGSGVAETYRMVATALQESLNALGVETSLSKREQMGRELRLQGKEPCFIAPTKNEILVNERKLIGSAQVRRKEGVIQHGSMPVSKAYRNLPHYERCSFETQERRKRLLAQHAISLSECIDKSYSFPEICTAFDIGFKKMLGESIT